MGNGIRESLEVRELTFAERLKGVLRRLVLQQRLSVREQIKLLKELDAVKSSSESELELVKIFDIKKLALGVSAKFSEELNLESAETHETHETNKTNDNHDGHGKSGSPNEANQSSMGNNTPSDWPHLEYNAPSYLDNRTLSDTSIVPGDNTPQGG